MSQTFKYNKYIMNITRLTLEYIFIINIFGDTNINIIVHI